MNNEITYTVSEIRNIIKESSQEFMPKLGINVEKDNKKNNQSAYKEIEKDVQDYDGGLNETNDDHKIEKVDGNMTTLDSSFTYDPGKEYKDRIKAQAKGYTSAAEEKNGIEKNGDFEKNEKIYDSLKDKHEEMSADKVAIKQSGLAAREMPKKVFDKDSMFESKLKTKRLYFKHSKFLNEEHMLSRIPEEYKKNGQHIIMKDADDNEYLVEWVVSDNISEGKVLKYTNKKHINEEMNRIKDLFNYKSSEYFKNTTAQSRLNEEYKVGEIINKAKNIE